MSVQLPKLRTRKPATAATQPPSAHSQPAASASDALRLHIVYRDPGALKASERQLRKRGRGQVEQLALNLRRFGCVCPILIHEDGTILDGHAIWMAACQIGMCEVPTVAISHLSPAEASTLKISLNRIQELSSWDEIALKTEIEVLIDVDLGLVGHTAFTTPQIDLILAPQPPKTKSDPADLLPSVGERAVSRAGDLWLFEGGHRLLCADARERDSFGTLMDGEAARLCAGDLPYNVKIRGHVSGRPAAREFAMGSGEMSPEAFTAFLRTIFENLAAHSTDGSLHLQFVDWRHLGEMMEAGRAAYDELINLCVWSKDNAGMGSLWRSQHELCFVWKHGRSKHLNNVELGRHGRHRSNVWAYPGANSFRSAREKAIAAHPTPKSVAMIADAILDVTERADIVLDPTVGSGTTLVAAHQTGRRGYGIELDPLYVDLTISRMEQFTKAAARHAATGLTFSETMAARVAAEAA
ncbi:DNA modification methylase [Methylobacterium sp. E-066]|uniref:DNA modification methylase n=1 Tax=Methylobacterium sp. E-066 TaxID=2836584 RepID=UPI001FBAA075|nr:DNA methyltransferase [Methylobacterium sp. E-066]MCJ2142105.1 DNA methylase N-4 [Methylobacterium sp. E-066]